MPVTDEHAQINGLRLHFRDWVGAAGRDAPLLLLLHGFTVHARSWDPFAETFTTRYHVIVPDARGHGESQWSPDAAYGVDHHTSDVVELTRALGYDRASLVGISMGGRTSYNVAARHPELVDRLVVVDISPAIAAAGAARIQGNVQSNDRFATREDAVAATLALNPGAPPATVRRRVEANLMLCDDGSWTWRYDAALRRGPVGRPDAEDQWPLLEQITSPTLVLRGADSDVLSAHDAERMVKAIPSSQFVEIPGAGHSIAVDQPALFLAAVVPFLLSE